MNKILYRLEKVFSLIRAGRLDIVLHKLLDKFTTKNRLLPFPFTLMIEPINSCNLHCPTCPVGNGTMNRPTRMMSLGEFKSIIDQVRGHVKYITLWNWGEPFLNRELLSMIKYATSAGMHVRTSTNGEFFKSKEFCLDLVKSGLQDLIICLDGADQQTINKFRQGSNFNEITDGFIFIHEAKSKLHSKIPRVALQFIIMKHNEHQRKYMRQLARQLDVDIYAEKSVGIDYNELGFQNKAKKFLPEDLSLSRYYLKQDGTFALKGKMPNRCSWVHQASVISSDGSVVPCCYDAQAEYIMGNVFEESLETIWNNEKYQSFRNQIIKDRKSIPICNMCSEDRYSLNI